MTTCGLTAMPRDKVHLLGNTVVFIHRVIHCLWKDLGMKTRGLHAGQKPEV